eukprot:GDKI01039343.1.p1 GENE.GDKI01039343.1~~GDKI01039343.1.p1  ORF type:complete len:143 (-),score=35.52 GDKI01039343.1:18-446(-)
MWIALVGPWVNVVTVCYWRQTDDLRAYALNQGLPFVLVPVILSLYAPPKGRQEKQLDYMLWVAWVLAVACKLTERIDRQIFTITFHLLSGHSVHHLCAVGAAMYIAEHCRRYANDCLKEGEQTDAADFLPTHEATAHEVATK